MKDIVIIHKSSILREGLASIIKQELAISAVLLVSVDDLNLHQFQAEPPLVLCDYKTAKQLSSHNFPCMVIQLTGEKDSGANQCIHMFDTNEQICQKLAPYVCSDDSQQKSNASQLTDRETEVLKLLAFGHANKEIADKLFISTHTVISHRKNITEKLGIKSVSGLTVYAIINNLIDTEGINIEDLI